MAALITMLGVAGSASAQVSDTAHKPSPNTHPATIIGYVVDSVGGPLSGVEIMVLAGDTSIVPSTMSDSLGNFAFRRVPAGGPYTLVARRLGYKPSRGRNIQLTAGDTLHLRFILNPIAVTLAPITVKGRRDRYALYADEIAAKMKGHRDLLDLMAWRRPFMFGDPYMCSPLDSLGMPIADEPRVRITRNLVFGPGQGGHKVRPADGIRFWNGFDSLKLNYIRHIYVNGMQVDITNDPIHTPVRIIQAIPMKYVAEIHYADCWDKTVPIYMQYSLFVTLKPLPQAQADSVYRFILAQAAAAGPVEGRVLLAKHPNRQQWDSLVRLLTGRDSTVADSAKPAGP